MLDKKIKLGEQICALGPEGVPVYEFINYDENMIKLVDIANPERYLLIDKQSLTAFSETFKILAKEYSN